MSIIYAVFATFVHPITFITVILSAILVSRININFLQFLVSVLIIAVISILGFTVLPYFIDARGFNFEKGWLMTFLLVFICFLGWNLYSIKSDFQGSQMTVFIKVVGATILGIWFFLSVVLHNSSILYSLALSSFNVAQETNIIATMFLFGLVLMLPSAGVYLIVWFLRKYQFSVRFWTLSDVLVSITLGFIAIRSLFQLIFS